VISLEETVIRKLKTAQHVLCSVESCTGGLISNLITNVSGASEVYWGGFVVYDNSAKEELGVPSQLLSSHGAVSLEVARELAERGLQKMLVSPGYQRSYSFIKPKGGVCVSTTGVAGPTGGSKEKPVGLCYIGIAISGRKTIVDEFRASLVSDRLQVKTQFAQKALEMIRINV
jgi:nicotinamide mononucleotide (NMN) deamidase PncC